jgi:hypothetical protein
VALLYIGRPRDRTANEMVQEYAKRLRRFCDFRVQQVAGETAPATHDRAYKVVLDP